MSRFHPLDIGKSAIQHDLMKILKRKEIMANISNTRNDSISNKYQMLCVIDLKATYALSRAVANHRRI